MDFYLNLGLIMNNLIITIQLFILKEIAIPIRNCHCLLIYYYIIVNLLIFLQFSMKINVLVLFRMISSNYLYLFLSFIAFFSVLLLYFYFKPNKPNLKNKEILRNLLESLDLELPDELKRIETSSSDPQNLSQFFII